MEDAILKAIGQFFGEGTINRRDFLKKTGQALVAIGGPELLATSGSGSAQEKGQKVQPPETGCYIGLHHGGKISEYYGGFVDKVGKKPKIITPPIGWQSNVLKRDPPPKDVLEMLTSWGAIPFLYRHLIEDIQMYGFSNLVTSKEFQQDITKYAQAMTEYGKPFLFTTMHELNIDAWPWSKQAGTAKKVWQTMWDIFEDNGANKYATWVWEVYTAGTAVTWVDDPEWYYPGDKYVDWIGLSAYSRDGNEQTRNMSFKILTEDAYSKMHRSHPDKPIMQAEFGKTKGPSQAKWFKNAFETIKSWPEMKAAIVWDVYDIGLSDDANLSDDTLKMLGEILKDPYFIGAK